MTEQTASESPSPFLTRKQAASYLNVPEAWLARTGRTMVPALKFGGHVRYNVSDLDRWATQQRIA
ncbi:helix-turn-helix domain-containing protein [Citricoccus sp.]|uniref:helix-turn-helix domain-containing protein n=1 Tax=Citricoccus sp. TaxID=1978372 RepID=UPI0028BE287C|nr:helix-turn-helix domain-containing protein [Citricoccus sp.]